MPEGENQQPGKSWSLPSFKTCTFAPFFASVNRLISALSKKSDFFLCFCFVVCFFLARSPSPDTKKALEALAAVERLQAQLL